MRALLLSYDCSIFTLDTYIILWVLSKEVSSTIFKVLGMTQPGIEPGHWYNCSSVRQWSGRPRFNPRSNHTKDSKMVLDAALLNT